MEPLLSCNHFSGCSLLSHYDPLSLPEIPASREWDCSLILVPQPSSSRQGGQNMRTLELGPTTFLPSALDTLPLPIVFVLLEAVMQRK
jgi:hypothetical protein